MHSLRVLIRPGTSGHKSVCPGSFWEQLCAWLCLCLPLLGCFPGSAQTPANQRGVVASFDGHCGQRGSRCRLLIDGSSLVIHQQFRLDPDGVVRSIVGSGRGKIIDNVTHLRADRLLGYTFLDCFRPASLRLKSCHRGSPQEGRATIVYEQDDLNGSIAVLFDDKLEWQRFQRSLRAMCESRCNLMRPVSVNDR